MRGSGCPEFSPSICSISPVFWSYSANTPKTLKWLQSWQACSVSRGPCRDFYLPLSTALSTGQSEAKTRVGKITREATTCNRLIKICRISDVGANLRMFWRPQ